MKKIHNAIPLSGGGDAALNCEVVDGTVQPTNPKENTIWVNTATKITSWVFSADEPAAAAAAGMVWVQTMDMSPVSINILKKNAVIVHPAVTKQYNNGAWEIKTASLYKDGAWQTLKADIRIIPNLTNFPASEWAYEGGTLTFNNDGTLKIAASGSTIYHRYLLTPLDLTNYSTIKYVFSNTTNAVHSYMGLAQSPKTKNTGWVHKIGGAQGTYLLDVSALTGEWYFAMYTAPGGTTCTLTLNEIEVLM